MMSAVVRSPATTRNFRSVSTICSDRFGVAPLSTVTFPTCSLAKACAAATSSRIRRRTRARRDPPSCLPREVEWGEDGDVAGAVEAVEQPHGGDLDVGLSELTTRRRGHRHQGTARRYGCVAMILRVICTILRRAAVPRWAREPGGSWARPTRRMPRAVPRRGAGHRPRRDATRPTANPATRWVASASSLYSAAAGWGPVHLARDPELGGPSRSSSCVAAAVTMVELRRTLGCSVRRRRWRGARTQTW